MALILEDGSGVASANSYISVVDAQAYFDLKGTTVTMTEEALINATQYLDLRFGQQYNGKQLEKEQSLYWPRTSFYDTDGFNREANTIPKELKNATAEAALLYLNGTALFDDTDTDDDNLQSLTNTVEGAVSQSKTWFKPTNTNTKSNIGKYLVKILKLSTRYATRVV